MCSGKISRPHIQHNIALWEMEAQKMYFYRANDWTAGALSNQPELLPSNIFLFAV